MARTLDDLYKFYRYIVRKQKGVYITPEEFADNLDNGQMDGIAEWFAQYGISQQIHDAIRGLRVYQPFTSDSSGFVTYPSNYLHAIGGASTVYGSTVTQPKYVNEDEWNFAITSQLRPVSLSAPIIVDTATGFSLYPQTTHIGFYWYLRRPLKVTYSYTQVGRVITFDPNNSQNLEVSEIYWNHVIALALRYASVNMDEAGIYQFAEQYSKETT